MTKVLLVSIVFFIIIIFGVHSVFGDTVHFNNKKVNGIIVEETPSHVVVETIIGKVIIKKDEITNIERMKPEENFLEMGNYCFEQRRYDDAINYYNKSLEVNPEYEDAKEALARVKKAKEEIALRKKTELENIKKEIEKKKKDLKEKIGMVVDEIDNQFKVVHIVKDSSSDQAQLKLYDNVITIEGTFTKGMVLEKVWELLLNKRPITLTIEREVNVLKKRLDYRKKTYIGGGILLDKDDKGLFISGVLEGEPAEKTGLKSGDRIITIDGNPTEGLSLEEVEKFFNEGEVTTVNIIIRRDLQIK